MPDHVFTHIGEDAEIVCSTRTESCDSCKEAILSGDKFLQIEYNTEDSRADLPYGINICKSCIKLAAKRLGVMR